MVVSSSHPIIRVLQPMNHSNSMKLQTLEPMLTESIYHFLTEFQKGRTDFSELSSIFFRLIQSMRDPPLEFIWFHSALTFHSSSSSSSPPLSLNNLFLSLISFHNPSHYKSISLLAPLLYHFISQQLSIFNPLSDILPLLDRILTYIIMSCASHTHNGEEECESEVGWLGLVPVWIADRVRETHGPVDGFRLFFPLLTEDMRKGIIVGDCGIKSLAVVVMVEAFLFRLCLMFDLGVVRVDLCEDVKSCAAKIIQGFKKNSLFLVMLFKLLLEPSLPVGKLLATQDELILRRVLYDVALDFGPFLSCDTSIDDAQYKELVVLWLFVANSALQFASENGDHVGVNCYLNAFSASQLPRQIISWVTGMTSVKPTAPDISSPKDIIGWLLVLEQQGFKICEHSISELQEKALKYSVMGKDNGVKDGQAMVEDAPVSTNGRRKRNSTGFWEVQKQIKVIKCCHENLGEDGFCGKTEVVSNSVSDQEMVDMVR